MEIFLLYFATFISGFNNSHAVFVFVYFIFGESVYLYPFDLYIIWFMHIHWKESTNSVRETNRFL